MKRATVVYVRFDDGTALIAKGDHASNVWGEIVLCQIIANDSVREKPMEPVGAEDRERVEQEFTRGAE